MSENPYHPPAPASESGIFAPERILFFARANLVLTGLGFGFLIFAKATQKNGFSWIMSGLIQLSPDELETFLTSTQYWIEIQQFYRALEGFLILFPSLFLISGISLLCKARWSVAATNVANALTLAGSTAFLGIYHHLINPRVPEMCQALGTEPRKFALTAFVGALALLISYCLIQLLILNRAVVRQYLGKL
ncbi:MAG: hypothetical protein ACON5N_11595 [Akkermansiaceae bacterium]